MRFATPSTRRRLTRATAFVVALAAPMLGLSAQSTPAADTSQAAPDTATYGALHLTLHDVGIAIGNARHVDGIRLNFRDSGHYVVHGLNATVWTTYPHADGLVQGIALGVPVTQAREIDGLGVGLGIGADDNLSGLAMGVGVGAGKSIRGIMIAGLGAGSGDDMVGIAIGGLGVGAGQNVRGILVGGLGVGAGHNVTGVSIAGLGAGAGNRVRGLSVAGLGVGAGQSIEGVSVAGLGVGAGTSVRGLSVAGIGIGAGSTVEGIMIAGVGVGAPRVRGLVVSLAAGGEDVKGALLAPAWVHIPRDGSFTGFSVSAFNQVKGTQHGFTLGIVNFARELHGVQLGLLNYAGNNRGIAKLLPFVNAHH
ncbi:MAG TPA: hypothetical protein VJO52_14765 [Gemmatimonadaceae bacterium]|nr:hypothetical protein [Gemmatimonadaceae bacterium]